MEILANPTVVAALVSAVTTVAVHFVTKWAAARRAQRVRDVSLMKTDAEIGASLRDELRNEVRGLRSRLESLEGEILDLKQQHRECVEENAALRSENAHLREQIEDLQATCVSHQAQLAVLRQRLGDAGLR